MISTFDLGLRYGGRILFDEVNIKFTPGNCYGLIGANGAGKSTFLKLLAGDVEPTNGHISRDKNTRLSFLKQDQNQFDAETVMNTVLMGNQDFYAVLKEREALYSKADFSDEDGIKSADLEVKFAEMNGYEAESEVGILLAGLGIPVEFNDRLMKDIDGSLKVKVLLAQALFGDPDILLMDEPTNHLDIQAIRWLEEFLSKFENTVIVVSHDRHFMNRVCTHIADIDFAKIKTYTGNYEFWKQACELNQKLLSDQNKKNEAKAKDLKNFIARFSANASKSKQATSRLKQLNKLELSDMPVSSRRYPFVGFSSKVEAGKDILNVEGLSKTVEGEQVLDNINFRVNKGDKIAFLSKNDVSISTLFDIVSGKLEADAGSFDWGITTRTDYFPSDNSDYFDGCDYSLVDWLRQYSEDKEESFIRGFLGKMLFSKDEALKKASVLSGGEKVRCMLSKMMLSGANVLILDHPTAHLDLEAVSALNDGLCKFDGTLLFASQDHEVVQTVANRIISLDGTIQFDEPVTLEEYFERTIPV